LTYYEIRESYLLTWQLRWDSEDEAAQFQRAFTELLRGKGARALEPGLWSVQGEYLWEGLKGRKVLVVVSKDQGLVRSALAYLPQHGMVN